MLDNKSAPKGCLARSAICNAAGGRDGTAESKETV